MEAIIDERLKALRTAIASLVQKQQALKEALEKDFGPPDVLKGLLCTIDKAVWRERLEAYILAQTLAGLQR